MTLSTVQIDDPRKVVWQQLVTNARSMSASLRRLVLTIAAAQQLKPYKNQRKSSLAVDRSCLLSTYNLVAAIIREFGFAPPQGEGMQQFAQRCRGLGVIPSEVRNAIDTLAQQYHMFGFELPAARDFAPADRDAREALATFLAEELLNIWPQMGSLFQQECLRQSSRGARRQSEALANQGNFVFCDCGTEIPRRVLERKASSAITGLGELHDGQVMVRHERSFLGWPLSKTLDHISLEELPEQAFAPVVLVAEAAVQSGLWQYFDSLPDSLILVCAPRWNQSFRGSPQAMREQICQHLREEVLRKWWDRPPLEQPNFRRKKPLLPEIRVAEIGSDPLTKRPLRAYGTLCLEEQPSLRGPFLREGWFLSKEEAEAARHEADKELPAIRAVVVTVEPGFVTARHRIAALVDRAARMAAVWPHPQPPQLLRKLQSPPLPTSTSALRSWIKEVEAILSALEAQLAA